jgi:cytidylate kinase
MAIITISCPSFSKGEEVAEKVARRLGYRIVSNEVIYGASEKFHVPQSKLAHAIQDAPSILDRFFSEKQKYIAYVAAETLTHFVKDNVVYYGLAGYFFSSHISPVTAKILAYFRKENVQYDGFAEQYYASTISHLLKVRVLAKLEDRVQLLMAQQELGRKQAMKVLNREDHARDAWRRHFYGADNTGAGLYDLSVHVDKLSVDDAVDIICDTAARPQFKTSADSQQVIEDLALAAAIKAFLFNDYPDCEVVVEKKSVEIYVRFTVHTDTMISNNIRESVLQLPGVSSVSVVLIPSVVFR